MSKELMDQDKKQKQSDAFGLGELTKEQKERAEIVRQTEASEALEGFRPLQEDGGFAYELQKQWILGEITSEERAARLREYYGVKERD